ncbi:MAG: hypothetical protein ACFCUV_05675 [Rivularia sp. (in: cyanobacteria)]
MIAFNVQEAIKRMKHRNKRVICWTLDSVIVEYKYISANKARNWDDSFADKNEKPNRIILQRAVWQDGFHSRYTNWW